MADAMPYRGPDDSGTWLSPDGRCALSHRRLSIIDTSAGGHQPFVLAEGRHAVTFNGEIYNYQDLRRRLRERGHALPDSCDSTVVPHLYEEEGDDLVVDGEGAVWVWSSAVDSEPVVVHPSFDRWVHDLGKAMDEGRFTITRDASQRRVVVDGAWVYDLDDYGWAPASDEEGEPA